MFNGSAISVTMLEGGIAELNFDLQGESVNKFNNLTVNELAEVLAILDKAEDVKGLLITSSKPVFVVGADITEFVSTFGGEHGTDPSAGVAENNKNLNMVESFDFPSVVAINGYAMGGGLEFCLACDFRVMSTAAKIGLPETKLGIIPGWGGTVRLPRIAGADTAIDWICSGKEQNAITALKAGVVDGIVAPEDLRDSALKVLQDVIDGKMDYESRRDQKDEPLKLNDTESMMVFETSKAFVAGMSGPNYPAPVKAIEVMQQAARKYRDDALKIEQDAFLSLVKTSASESLVGIFLSDQLIAKKAKVWAKKSDKKVTRAAVLGAGIMGGGIAYQSAIKGTPIKMKDINQEGLDLGMSEANKLLSKAVKRKKMSVEKMGETLARIDPTMSYDNFDDIDVVVEAVVENPNVKSAVLAELEDKVSDDTVIASNTSTISITYLAKALKRPENFCGMHFFNPVHRMPLVEVIRGEKSSDTAIARTVAYANAMGKKAIVVKDCPGFLVNRVLFPYLSGFMDLLRDGADFKQVDKVMEKFGWPMGPAYLMDVVGLDTAHHSDAVMAEGFPDRMNSNYKKAANVLYEANRLGQKNGLGFYKYELDKKGKPKKTVDPTTYDLISEVTAERKEFTADEIIARMMVPMATELARCLEEGIVETPAEADMALVYGVGFPPFRGGIFRWIDNMGTDKFVAMSDQIKSLGTVYDATETQRKMAANGDNYYA